MQKTLKVIPVVVEVLELQVVQILLEEMEVPV